MIQKIYGRKEIEGYDPIEETQKMKNSQDNDPEESSDKKKSKKNLFLFSI
jgi:hypothetical protein